MAEDGTGNGNGRTTNADLKWALDRLFQRLELDISSHHTEAMARVTGMEGKLDAFINRARPVIEAAEATARKALQQQAQQQAVRTSLLIEVSKWPITVFVTVLAALMLYLILGHHP